MVRKGAGVRQEARIEMDYCLREGIRMIGRTFGPVRMIHDENDGKFLVLKTRESRMKSSTRV